MQHTELNLPVSRETTDNLPVSRMQGYTCSASKELNSPQALEGGLLVFRHSFTILLVATSLLCSCSDSSRKEADAEQDNEAPEQEAHDSGIDEVEDSVPELLEISPGVGIGPAELGGSYGELVSKIGPPDSSFDYFRVIFAVWFSQGIEVVFSSGVDAELADDSPIVSVGTKLREGYTGLVVPGMTRSEAESLIGECVDVIDDVHCYHPVGLYLGFGADGIVQTVAIHPVYTARPEPPEMEVSLRGAR